MAQEPKLRLCEAPKAVVVTGEGDDRIISEAKPVRSRLPSKLAIAEIWLVEMVIAVHAIYRRKLIPTDQ